MSQKSTHGWMIGAIIGFFLWFVVWSVFDWLLYQSLASLLTLMGGLIIGLVIMLALGNKYPSLRSGVKGFAVGFAVYALVGGVVGFVVYPQIYSLTNPNFKILEINDTYANYGYTFYARIWNDGIDGSEVVTCIVTKADLTTISKSQTLSLSHNEEKSISFYFSVAQVGTEPTKYLIKIDS